MKERNRGDRLRGRDTGNLQERRDKRRRGEEEEREGER